MALRRALEDLEEVGAEAPARVGGPTDRVMFSSRQAIGDRRVAERLTGLIQRLDMCHKLIQSGPPALEESHRLVLFASLLVLVHRRGDISCPIPQGLHRDDGSER